MPTRDPHTLQEFYDLVALSSLDLELKVKLISLSEVMDEEMFQEILDLLREEDKLDKDIQHYQEDLINFDNDDYLNKVQNVVNEEVKKHLSSIQNSEFRTQNS